MKDRALLQAACYAVSAIALVGAGAYLLLGDDKGLGIFLVLMAAIVCRVLILDVAESQR